MRSNNELKSVRLKTLCNMHQEVNKNTLTLTFWNMHQEVNKQQGFIVIHVFNVLNFKPKIIVKHPVV